MENKKYCFALDLKNDAVLINEYITHHKKVWPEIIESIKDSHIEKLEIYL
ncbi:MAG: L-rhamnose mutarotase, partial [Maribacter stanieri]